MTKLFKFSLVFLTLIFANFLSVQKVQAASTCVFNDLGIGEACPVFATARAVEFLDVGDDAIIFIDSADQARTSVVASTRVEDAVLLEQIDEDEGLLLEHEVQELSGARYELPKSRSAVKKQLGFPDNAEIAVEDWTEMIRVHAETVLSISAIASRFILEQVGLISGSAQAALGAPVVTATAPGQPQKPDQKPDPTSDPVVIETH